MPRLLLGLKRPLPLHQQTVRQAVEMVVEIRPSITFSKETLEWCHDTIRVAFQFCANGAETSFTTHIGLVKIFRHFFEADDFRV